MNKVRAANLTFWIYTGRQHKQTPDDLIVFSPNNESNELKVNANRKLLQYSMPTIRCKQVRARVHGSENKAQLAERNKGGSTGRAQDLSYIDTEIRRIHILRTGALQEQSEDCFFIQFR